MSKHTPEPWEAIKLDGYPHSRIIAPNHEGHCRFVYDAGGVGAHADMSRAVQCVNALAGIADPEAIVKSHGELVDLLSAMTTAYDDARSQTQGHVLLAAARAALANAAAIKGDAPATTDDWRVGCTVDRGLNGWNVHTEDDKRFLAAAYAGPEMHPYWCSNKGFESISKPKRMCIFTSESEARAALAKAPKPPEGEPK